MELLIRLLFVDSHGLLSALSGPNALRVASTELP